MTIRRTQLTELDCKLLEIRERDIRVFFPGCGKTTYLLKEWEGLRQWETSMLGDTIRIRLDQERAQQFLGITTWTSKGRW